ncbi:MAG: dockerin type I repeat-containing protein, partial [Clostridia bacterium]|nr:dockerin type I repeat-containing protein [Clostridia bacterium]
ETLKSVYQDYCRWMDEGLVDMIHPMAYTTDNAAFESILKNIVSKGYTVPVAPGLGTYTSGYTSEIAMDQIMIARRYGCVGVVHFQAVPFLNRNLPLVLNASVCRGVSYLPYRDSVRACENAVDILLRRASTALAENGAVSAPEIDALKKAGDATKETFSAPEPTDSALQKAVGELKSASASGILQKDLTRLERLMTFLRADGDETLVPVERGKTVLDFAKSESVSDVCLRNGFPATLTDLIATGMYVLKNGIRRAAVVLGDLNGDGEISAIDYLLCKRHVLGTGLLSGPYLQAARIAGSDDVSAVDYLRIKKHVLDLGDIPLI